MKDFNYSEKFKHAQTQEERNTINDEYIKYRRKARRIEKVKKYIVDNILIFIDLFLSLLGIIIAIISLSR